MGVLDGIVSLYIDFLRSSIRFIYFNYKPNGFIHSKEDSNRIILRKNPVSSDMFDEFYGLIGKLFGLGTLEERSMMVYKKICSMFERELREKYKSNPGLIEDQGDLIVRGDSEELERLVGKYFNLTVKK